MNLIYLFVFSAIICAAFGAPDDPRKQDAEDPDNEKPVDDDELNNISRVRVTPEQLEKWKKQQREKWKKPRDT